MEVGQKIYYVNYQGGLYLYEVIDITDKHIVVALVDNRNFITAFTHAEAKILMEKYSTLEKAQAEAEKRRNAILYGI